MQKSQGTPGILIKLSMGRTGIEPELLGLKIPFVILDSRRAVNQPDKGVIPILI